MAGQQLVQVAVKLGQPRPGGQRFGGELADQVGGQLLGRHRLPLSGGGGQGPVSQGLDLAGGQPAGGLQVLDQAAMAGGAELGRGDIAADQPQAALGGQVKGPFQAGMDRGQQVVQPAQAAGLLIGQVAAAAGQQPDLQVQLHAGLDGPQIAAGADLVGDHPGIARVALAFAAAGRLAGPVDGQPGHIDQPEAGHGEHGLDQVGDPPDHVHPHHQPLAEAAQLLDQGPDRGRVVVHPPVKHHLAGVVDHTGPVDLFGDVDPDPHPHLVLPPTPMRLSLLFLAGNALHSDGSQSLISGPGRAAGQGDLPPEPWTAASLRTIPTPPASRNPGTGQPGHELNGRAA